MKNRFFFALVCAVVLVVLGATASSFAVVVAASPTVSEMVDESGNIEYTIHNPEFSGIEVIALLVSNNTEPDPYRYVDNAINGAWTAESDAVTSSSWDTVLMGEAPEAPYAAVAGSTTTWANFTGESFTTAFNASDNVMGYFLDYGIDDVSGDYNFMDLSNAVAEGENRGGFHADAFPMSDYLLVVTDDTDDNVVDPASTFTFFGAVVPEPVTMLLFGVGSALLRKR